jgi:hypothetical protein
LKERLGRENAYSAKWGFIPGQNSAIEQKENEGIGDPCAFYFGADGWRLPSQSEWQNLFGYVGATVTAGQQWSELNKGASWVSKGATNGEGTLPIGGVVGDNNLDGKPDWSVFLPATSNRSGIASGNIEGSPMGGSYWTSTLNSGINPYLVSFTDITGPYYGARNSRIPDARAIRCMKGASSYTFSVTPSELLLPPEEVEETLSLTTDYRGEWSATIWNTRGGSGTTARTWLSFENESEPGVVRHTGNANFKLKVKQNTELDERRAYVLITVGSQAVDTVAILQNRGSIHAAPGVIGYYATGPMKNQLTIAGSSVYKGTPIETAAAAEFGPLADVPVYVAYFRWGSLVATSSTSSWNEDFSLGDVIMGSDADNLYNTAALKSNIGELTDYQAWQKIPVSKLDNWANTSGYTKENGFGNPCVEYFKGFNGKNWKLPSSGGAGWNGGTFGNENSLTWGSSRIPSGANWVSWKKYPSTDGDIPVIGAVAGNGDGTRNWSMFLPAAGMRGSNDGSTENKTMGYYWSGTKTSTDNGLYLKLLEARPEPHRDEYVNNAMAIRCVPDVPEPVVPEPGVGSAPKGVIGYYGTGENKGELTIEGDGHNGERVFVAYFKVGSLVATRSYATHMPFTAADIVGVAANEGDFDVEALKNSMKNMSGQTAWNKINDARQAGVLATLKDGQSITEALGTSYLSQGLGDPCAYFTGWRMPSNEDMNDFIGYGGSKALGTYKINVNYPYTNANKVFYQFEPNGLNAANPGMAVFPEGLAQGAKLPAAEARKSDGTLDVTNYYQGIAGRYWTSTSAGWLSSAEEGVSESGDKVYALQFLSTYAVPQSRVSPIGGWAVRCVPNVPRRYKIEHWIKESGNGSYRENTAGSITLGANQPLKNINIESNYLYTQLIDNEYWYAGHEVHPEETGSGYENGIVRLYYSTQEVQQAVVVRFTGDKFSPDKRPNEVRFTIYRQAYDAAMNKVGVPESVSRVSMTPPRVSGLSTDEVILRYPELPLWKSEEDGEAYRYYIGQIDSYGSNYNMTQGTLNEERIPTALITFTLK